MYIELVLNISNVCNIRDVLLLVVFTFTVTKCVHLVLFFSSFIFFKHKKCKHTNTSFSFLDLYCSQCEFVNGFDDTIYFSW